MWQSHPQLKIMKWRGLFKMSTLPLNSSPHSLQVPSTSTPPSCLPNSPAQPFSTLGCEWLRSDVEHAYWGYLHAGALWSSSCWRLQPLMTNGRWWPSFRSWDEVTTSSTWEDTVKVPGVLGISVICTPSVWCSMVYHIYDIYVLVVMVEYL